MRTQTFPLLALSLTGIVLAAGRTRAEAPPALEIAPADKAKMVACTDGKSHYVVIGPHEIVTHTLFYGDGKDLSEVRSDAGGMLPGTDFLEPRFPNPSYNPSFRGLDMRLYSAVDYDADKKTCALRCGERKLPLTLVAGPEAQKIIASASFHKSIKTREPHALARDDHGTYYYVDRGATPETRSNFRVYVGRKGALKLQKMKDVASDSGGEVYSTASGDLRLITSNQVPEFTWLQGKRQVKLVVLPVAENLTLIYTTLGVYSGQRFGTPCDDL